MVDLFCMGLIRSCDNYKIRNILGSGFKKLQPMHLSNQEQEEGQGKETASLVSTRDCTGDLQDSEHELEQRGELPWWSVVAQSHL